MTNDKTEDDCRIGFHNRSELGSIIFDALGLTQGERDAVYEAVIDLVSKRLQRAQTITG